MKRQISVVLLSICLLTIFTPSLVSNASSDVLWDSYDIPSTRQKERLVDNADLLTSSEEADILAALNKASEENRMNIAILTVDEHTGSIQAYADDYFDYNGFQADFDGAGILFMLSMADREYAISTCGDGIAAFTDYGQEYLVDQMMPYLKEGDYYGAFEEYIEACNYLLSCYDAEEGTAYDIGNVPATPRNLFKGLIICVVIGLIAGLIPIFIMVSDLQTVHPNANASGYQTHSGLHMTTHRDTYLRTNTSRTRKPENDSRSGGGSSVHISSSGSSHGGSSGHF
ncbi:TPM domain-containing protein [Butyrivibrio sp. YAB3001]|uniref:TPM domain-containing protein n=1 Tax=Butyrivibrio sp. YAB3001 TaxID=1520812 RepID=UPI001588107D|nr:TPM domain-containing protein [Butyrivibrio sp. YAB3001]